MSPPPLFLLHFLEGEEGGTTVLCSTVVLVLVYTGLVAASSLPYLGCAFCRS